MSGELSNQLPWLTTAGNRIVRADGKEPVLLRGVNRSGLEYSSFPNSGITEAQIEEIVNGWGCNIIRLPFNQTWALNDDTYLDGIGQIVQWASKRGAYTLLDLQWIDNVIKQAPLPNDDSIRMWTKLATRYQAESAVLYDIFNEPHDTTLDQWRNRAVRIVDAIRTVHPMSLIFVGGMDWSFDLRGVPLDRDALVYSSHVYPNKPRNWPDAFGNLAGEVPVFLGEWGGEDKDVEGFGRKLAAYLNELGIGWTAWSWVDWPHLMANGQPTPFGHLVKEQLSVPRV
ncbi:MAG: hypothetical protein NVS9B12_14430 [Vulcanimicrobiaceae bacterium]